MSPKLKTVPPTVTHWGDDRGLFISAHDRRGYPKPWKDAFCIPGTVDPRTNKFKPVTPVEKKPKPKEGAPTDKGQIRDNPKWVKARQKVMEATNETAWLSAMYWYLSIPMKQESVLDETFRLDPGQTPVYKWANRTGSVLNSIQFVNAQNNGLLVPKGIEKALFEGSDFNGLPVVYKAPDSVDQRPMLLVVQRGLVQGSGHKMIEKIDIYQGYALYEVLH